MNSHLLDEEVLESLKHKKYFKVKISLPVKKRPVGGRVTLPCRANRVRER